MLLSVGNKAPEIETVLENGEKFILSSFKGKWIVLYFYPKDNTSGCTQEACDFRDNMSRIKSFGAEIFGISPDTERSHLGFMQKYNLNFHLLVDTDKEISKLYDVIGEKSLYGRKYIGVIRSTFLINPDGIISKVFYNVKVSGHVDEIINSLQQLIG